MSKGQVSMELLLISAGFFTALAIILPSVSFALGELLISNDAITIKNTGLQINAEKEFLELLANNSKKEVVISPINNISVNIKNKSLILFNERKETVINFKSDQKSQNNIFSSPFVILLEKKKGKIIVSCYKKEN